MVLLTQKTNKTNKQIDLHTKQTNHVAVKAYYFPCGPFCPKTGLFSYPFVESFSVFSPVWWTDKIPWGLCYNFLIIQNGKDMDAFGKCYLNVMNTQLQVFNVKLTLEKKVYVAT